MPYKHSEIPSLLAAGAKVSIIKGKVVATNVPDGFVPVKTKSLYEKLKELDDKVKVIEADVTVLKDKVKP